jgi:hypothetical protein
MTMIAVRITGVLQRSFHSKPVLQETYSFLHHVRTLRDVLEQMSIGVIMLIVKRPSSSR